MSICFQKLQAPVPVLRWSPSKWRKAEAIRDKIMRGVGTDEPWIMDEPSEVDAITRRDTGRPAISGQWRKPLRVDEVAQMAPTPEVRDRQGRG
jgi:hypothetical protein